MQIILDGQGIMSVAIIFNGLLKCYLNIIFFNYSGVLQSSLWINLIELIKLFIYVLIHNHELINHKLENNAQNSRLQSSIYA